MITEIVQVKNIDPQSAAALDRYVPDYGQQTPLSPLKPFEVEGVITSIGNEAFGAVVGGRPESEGVKFMMTITKVISEPPFTTGKGLVTTAQLRPGDEMPTIYFHNHPNMQFAITENIYKQRLLLATIAGADVRDASFRPSIVLQKLQGQQLRIPIRMRRTYVRTTRGGADLFNDSFELIKG